MDYLTRIITSWGNIIAYGALDYIAEYMVGPAITPIVGTMPGRYLTTGALFSAKVNLPANVTSTIVGFGGSLVGGQQQKS